MSIVMKRASFVDMMLLKRIFANLPPACPLLGWQLRLGS
jgi:hypothetical protein